uniref:Uncharacterized protein n=1 Tax=Rhizophora mucronata TaxID=61149 RepID=A0A2P2MKC9_RHIMU
MFGCVFIYLYICVLYLFPESSSNLLASKCYLKIARGI